MIERRPWGWFVLLMRTPFAWVKVLRVRDGHRTSLQWHALRREYWMSLASGGAATVGHQELRLFALMPVVVERGRWHRVTGPALIVEVAWGVPDEDDVHRVDDDYGRA